MTVSTKCDEILRVAKDVASYANFRSMTKLGISVGLNDLPFEKAMVFSWIQEELDNGRKN